VDYGASSPEQSTPLNPASLSSKTLEDFSPQKPIATWNSARGVWETNQPNLFCEHWEPFLETWPTSGMTRNGQAFERPTLVRHITDSASLSSPTLPTPKARDAQAEGYEAGLRRATPQVGTIVKALVDGDERVLFPTPQVMDTLPARTGEARERQLRRGEGENASRRNSSGNLREDILDLLPTATARDYKDGSQPHERNGVIQTDTLARAILNGQEILLPTVLANSPMRTSRRAMTTKEGGYAHVSLNQAIEIAQGILPKEFESWDEVPKSIKPEILLPTVRARSGANSARSEVEAGDPKNDSK